MHELSVKISVCVCDNTDSFRYVILGGGYTQEDILLIACAIKSMGKLILTDGFVSSNIYVYIANTTSVQSVSIKTHQMKIIKNTSP